MFANIIYRDGPLRAVGLLLLVAAAACVRLLFTGPAAGGAAGVAGALEATLGFLAGSSGAVFLLLGRHVHDQVSVSSPWLGNRR